MPVISIATFERFFRVAAVLDVDKSDLKRYNDFVNWRLHDLLIRGKAPAKANGRYAMNHLQDYRSRSEESPDPALATSFSHIRSAAVGRGKFIEGA